MYRTARFNYAIPCKLEEQALRHARSFYDTIGYNGVFALAVDATAVVPTMRVKGNKIIGLATERNVIVSSAQDILNGHRGNTFLRARYSILLVSIIFKIQNTGNFKLVFNASPVGSEKTQNLERKLET